MFERLRVHAKEKPQARSYLITIFGGIGDTNFALATAQQIHHHQPDAKVTILCNKLQADVLEDDPTISTQIIQNDLFSGSEESHQRRSEFITEEKTRGYDALFSEGFQMSLDLRGIASKNPLYREWKKYKFRDILRLKPVFTPQYETARAYVNSFLGKPNTIRDKRAPIDLYISKKHFEEASVIASDLLQLAEIPDGKLLLVAPDTSGEVTRPPAELLKESIADALTQRNDLVVGIMPSYTSPEASTTLHSALVERFGNRIQLISDSQRWHLLTTTALIDQADTFLVGDTGLMHLAVTRKISSDGKSTPRNNTTVISLWGGTNPQYYGYPQHSVLIGADNPVQQKYRPGINKNDYPGKAEDFFRHIKPDMISQAILDSLSTPRT